SGVNVFRINFSHADYFDIEDKVRIIRELNDEFQYNTTILADLQGPKLRVGVMKDEVVLKSGDHITFSTEEEFLGTSKRVYMNYKSFPQDVTPGEARMRADGKWIVRVLGTGRLHEGKAEVVQGGPLRPKKGGSLPN